MPSGSPTNRGKKIFTPQSPEVHTKWETRVQLQHNLSLSAALSAIMQWCSNGSKCIPVWRSIKITGFNLIKRTLLSFKAGVATTLCRNLPAVLFFPPGFHCCSWLVILTCVNLWALPIIAATCFACILCSCDALRHWRHRRLQGVIAGRTFARQVIEISRGDIANGSHNRASTWQVVDVSSHSLYSCQLCLFQYSIYIVSTKPLRVVSPFINCSKAKQTWAAHSSSWSWCFFFSSH